MVFLPLDRVESLSCARRCADRGQGNKVGYPTPLEGSWTCRSSCPIRLPGCTTTWRARPSRSREQAAYTMRTRLLARRSRLRTCQIGARCQGAEGFDAVGIVTDYLVSLGIPREELGHIDTLVNFDFERSTPAGFRCHVFGAPVPPDHLLEVAEGLLVVDEVMCFVQAGSWMSEPEQLEYGYEICARYHLNHLSTDDYVEMGQRYTVAI